MTVINLLLAEQHLEFLSLKGGCTGSSESTLVKMPHCWKSHLVVKTLLSFTRVNTVDCYTNNKVLIKITIQNECLISHSSKTFVMELSG